MSRDGLPTGAGTAATNDVADPHPAREEKYDRERKPGGANPPKDDLGPNPSIHDGTKQRPPRNVETESDDPTSK